jgi:hypothetical protein
MLVPIIADASTYVAFWRPVVLLAGFALLVVVAELALIAWAVWPKVP